MIVLTLCGPSGCKVYQGGRGNTALMELLAQMDSAPAGTIKWMHLQSPTEETMRSVWERSGFHELEMEDVRTSGHTPKIDVRPEHVFAIWHGSQSLRATGSGGTPEERNGEPQDLFELDTFVGSDYVITISAGVAGPVEELIEGLKTGARVMEPFADMILYSILVELTDSFLPVLESIDDEIEDIEEAVLAEAQDDQLAKLFKLKRRLTALKKVVLPQREAASKLTWAKSDFIREESRFHFSDVHDRMIMVMEMLETSRDLASSAVDLCMTTASNRLNVITTRLTIIATIFLPLTFVAGVYGMNFESFMPGAMPEFHIPYFYALLWGVMLTIGITLLVYFKRRRWF